MKIVTFNPEFIPLQVELGKKVREKYSYGFYSSIEQLEESYKAENFDPELKLYAFEDDKLVGFVTANLTTKNTVDIDFPHVIDLEERKTVILYEKEISENDGQLELKK